MVPEDEEAEEGRLSDPVVDELLKKIEALEEEVRRLRSELISEKVHVPVEWRLAPQEETIYRLLASRDFVSNELFKFALYPDINKEIQDAEGLIKGRIYWLRRKLKPYGMRIINTRHIGWSLKRTPAE
jgi:hypothetical protein